MLLQIQQLCRPDGALKMVRFSPATKISPQWGSMIAVISQFLFHQVDFNFKRNPPDFPLDPISGRTMPK